MRRNRHRENRKNRQNYAPEERPGVLCHGMNPVSALRRLLPAAALSGWILTLCTVPALADEEGSWQTTETAEVICSAPDGNNGWYRNTPEVTIRRPGTGAVAEYMIETPSGKRITGELLPDEQATGPGEKKEQETGPDGPDEQEAVSGGTGEQGADGTGGKGTAAEAEKEDENEDAGNVPDSQEKECDVTLPDTVWEDGENILTVRTVRMQDGEELSREVRTILLDRTAPDEIRFSYPASAVEGTMYYSSEIRVEVSCSDDVSGIEKIAVALENGEETVIDGDSGQISVRPGYRGRIRAYAVNGAGTVGSPAVSDLLVCEDRGPKITWKTEKVFGIWHQENVEIEVSVQEDESYGFASGLRSLTCYAGGHPVAGKTWEDSGKCVLSGSLRFRVAQSSLRGNPVTVTVHAADRAGNTVTKSEEIYIDRTAPILKISGLHDQMITAERVTMLLEAAEENILESCIFSVKHTGPDGEVSEYEEDGKLWMQTENGRKTELTFQKDGVYECVFAARDAAGHRTERKIRFSIDSQSPVIRYVEQMNGASIPYFQWNYSREEMVRDFTEYTCRMILDGRLYLPGTRITDEGPHLLEVRAEDAAGNVSAATAFFTIDRTPPQIRWGNTVDGGSYEEKAELSVWVDGEGERLTYLALDGTVQKLSPDSIIFQTEISGYGKHTVEVRAMDRTGNLAEERIQFEISARQGFFSRVIRAADNAVGKTDPAEPDGGESGSGMQRSSLGSAIVCAVGVRGAVTVGVIMGIVIFRKKKKKW